MTLKAKRKQTTTSILHVQLQDIFHADYIVDAANGMQMEKNGYYNKMHEKCRSYLRRI